MDIGDIEDILLEFKEKKIKEELDGREGRG